MCESSTPLAAVLQHLDHVRQHKPGEFKARCPAHDDATPSLSIRAGPGGKVLVHCFAGCSAEAVLASAGLSFKDLRPTESAASGRRPRAGPTGRIRARYPYRRPDGSLAFQVERVEPKGFRCRRPDADGGWLYDLAGVRKILYRLPDWHDAPSDSHIYVVEGEKDADRLAKRGLLATTNPGGAGKWSAVDDSPLEDRDVVIVPDNDDAGRAHAENVARALHGRATSVRIVQLPKLPPKGDVSDWLDAGNEPEDLWRLAESADNWTPSDLMGELVRLSDVVPGEVRWLWSGRIPLGKLTMLVGDPGLGKSLVTIDLAARVTRGRDWPDGAAAMDGPAGVVIASAEDDAADTIRPRFDAAGGDPDRVSLVPAFENLSDLTALEHAIEKTPHCRLVIIDPVTAYLNGGNANRNEEVRGLLKPLADLAARRGVAILLVSHLRKGEGRAIYRSIGSIGWVAAVRAAWLFTRDPDDPARRLLLSLKSNLAPDQAGLACRIEDRGGVPLASWGTSPVHTTPDEALSPKPGPEPEARREAEDFLRQELAAGPRPAPEIKKLAEEAGITEGTLRRARESLEIKSRKAGFGKGWVWELAGSTAPPPETAKTCAPSEGSAHLRPASTEGPAPAIPNEGPQAQENTKAPKMRTFPQSTDHGGLGPRFPPDPLASAPSVRAEAIRRNGQAAGETDVPLHRRRAQS